MNTIMTLEISLTIVLSVVALSLSAYSIYIAKKRDSIADLKKMTETLTSMEKDIELLKEERTDKKELTNVITRLVTELEPLKKTALEIPKIKEKLIKCQLSIETQSKRVDTLVEKTLKGK